MIEGEKGDSDALKEKLHDDSQMYESEQSKESETESKRMEEGEAYPGRVIEDMNGGGQEESELEFTKKQIDHLSNRALGAFYDAGGYSVGVFLASVLLLVKSSADHPVYLSAFAITLSVISVVVSANFVYMTRTNRLEARPRLILIVFLFILWLVAVGVFTFIGPYTATGNGYFACWGGFLCAFKLLADDVSRVGTALNSFSSLGLHMELLLLFSIVTTISAIQPCADSGCRGTTGYALALGIVSIIFCIVLIYLNKSLGLKVQLAILYFLTAWWTIGVFICTFIGPFSITGNGYFGCWISLIASILMLYKLK